MSNPNPNLDNLKPFVKGQIANPNGRPKGVKNWATVIQDLLGDEDLIDKVVKTKPSYWDDLPVKNGATLIAVAMMIKAMQGDKNAAEWLSKTGFKQEIDITTNGNDLNVALVRFIGDDNDDDDTVTT